MAHLITDDDIDFSACCERQSKWGSTCSCSCHESYDRSDDAVKVGVGEESFLTVACTCEHGEDQGEPRHDLNYNDSGCTAEGCYCEHGIPITLGGYW